ncbi:MAG: ATPase [Cereibacter sphaeroides]|uniref:ATPase n=1 Tax=Cereibacter sphaeroides TaxID=1063 RepID=A0A2W5S4V2_CERSP|nr:MAG: ATPase [Cereibacter sphaeroides]
MKLYLGIDGGGTGCRAAVCDASGKILGEGRGGPANITTDSAVARQNILSAARAALPDGARFEDMVVVMGLAGANVAGSVARFSAGMPFARLRVETDAVTAAKGALRDGDGIVAAIGTGSVFAVQRVGELRQIGGWGLVIGDEGSGGWLGKLLLARTLRALDGYVPMTPLAQTILDEMGGADGIVAFARDAQPVDFAALAPRIVGSEDPAALAILRDGEAKVAEAVEHLQREGTVPVIFLGGLGAIYASRLAGRWPMAEAIGSGLDGALWLARQEG